MKAMFIASFLRTFLGARVEMTQTYGSGHWKRPPVANNCTRMKTPVILVS